MFLAATATYFLALDGPLWLCLLLTLASDISMLAYLAGPGIGSRGYNAAHTYSAPLALAGAGLWFSTPVAVLAALVRWDQGVKPSIYGSGSAGRP